MDLPLGYDLYEYMYTNYHVHYLVSYAYAYMDLNLDRSGIKFGNRTFKMDQLTLYFYALFAIPLSSYSGLYLSISLGHTIYIYLDIISSSEHARRSRSDDKSQGVTRS
jgi:hypothetical protein